jgi:hypothetical protein
MFSYTAFLQYYEKPALIERMPGVRGRLLGLTGRELEDLERYHLIRVIEVRRPGRKWPIKLVHIPSLLEYLERVEMLKRNSEMEKIRAGYAHHHKNEGEPVQAESSFLQVVPAGEER